MHFEEKPPNHERWIISYADFTTLLLATFVVMYAVSSINSSKFQEMAEAFSTAFIGRTVTLDLTGLAAENKSQFDFMPSPVHVPVITREPQIKSLPPALRQEEPKRQAAGADEESKARPTVLKRGQIRAPVPQMRDLVERTGDDLEAAYRKLEQALASMIGKGQVQVSLRELGVVIDINEVLLFHNGKAELTLAALPLIDEIAAILKGLQYQIQVNGFTDNVPIHNPTFDFELGPVGHPRDFGRQAVCRRRGGPDADRRRRVWRIPPGHVQRHARGQGGQPSGFDRRRVAARGRKRGAHPAGRPRKAERDQPGRAWSSGTADGGSDPAGTDNRAANCGDAGPDKASGDNAPGDSACRAASAALTRRARPADGVGKEEKRSRYRQSGEPGRGFSPDAAGRWSRPVVVRAQPLNRL